MRRHQRSGIGRALQPHASTSSTGNSAAIPDMKRSTDARLSTTFAPQMAAVRDGVRIRLCGSANQRRRLVAARWEVPEMKKPRVWSRNYTVCLSDGGGRSGSVARLRIRRASREEAGRFYRRKAAARSSARRLFPEIVTLRSVPDDRRFPTSLWGNGVSEPAAHLDMKTE